MILSFFAGMVSMGWGQVLDPDSVRFEKEALLASVRGEVAELQLSIAFLSPEQDPASLSWSTSVIGVHDAAIRLSPKDWFSDQIPKGGILLLRFGPGEMVWGIRQLHLAAGENLFGVWGLLSSKQISLPDGVDTELPANPCSFLRITASEVHAGKTGLMIMPFEEANPCRIDILTDSPVTAFCLPGLRAWSLEDLNLVQAGFTGGANPVLSDRIWKQNPVTGNVDATYWYRSTDQSWRSSVEGFPAAPDPLFFPGDIVVIKPRVSPRSWVLTPGSN